MVQFSQGQIKQNGNYVVLQFRCKGQGIHSLNLKVIGLDLDDLSKNEKGNLLCNKLVT